MKKIIAMTVLSLMMLTNSSFAAEALKQIANPVNPNPAPVTPAQPPVEISAAKSLVWNRKDKSYTAHEKVIVTQGVSKIQCDKLTARYSDDNSPTDISTLEAISRVIIQSPPYTAYGDNAVYNVATGNATLTGKNLKITTDADVMTARDKVEFYGSENRLVAAGKAFVKHGADTISADTLIAYFSKDSSGKLVTNKVAAHGNITITTAKETVTGDEGVYDIPTQKAALTGKVTIRQGENWLEGTRANIDMATGISQLLGNDNPNTESRVKGVFYPKAAVQKPGSLKN